MYTTGPTQETLCSEGVELMEVSSHSSHLTSLGGRSSFAHFVGGDPTAAPSLGVPFLTPNLLF